MTSMTSQGRATYPTEAPSAPITIYKMQHAMRKNSFHHKRMSYMLSILPPWLHKVVFADADSAWTIVAQPQPPDKRPW